MDKVDQSGKIITCILPKGNALELLQALYDKGVTRANFAFARGSEFHDPEEVEKEVVTVVAKNKAEADELFEFIFDKAGVNRLGGGLIYMSQLTGASAYALPEIQN